MSNSCRELFKDLKILPLHSEYIFSLSLFVVKNKDQSNQENHSINTIYSINLHLPTSSLAVYQRGLTIMELRVFNHLPPNIKSLSNEVRLLQPALKRFLLSNSFYSLDGYFDCHFNI
jgi:hypothetical protein